MNSKEYGSGHFGEWITDENGLPAYKYTCNQLVDEKAKTATHKEWRNNTEHLHQVGNDRVVGVASNYGYVQLRQDEGSPKFLNDYDPKENHYGGGLGYLVSGDSVLSTYYTGEKDHSFTRVLGPGYFQKKVANDQFTADQIIFAPFGDDPLLISQTTIENKTAEDKKIRWIEYWGTQLYQFSYKSFMVSLATKKHPHIHRRALGKKFVKHAEILKGNLGIIVSQNFSGYTRKEKRAWKTFVVLAGTVGKKLTGGNLKPAVKEAVYDDLNPPMIFVASLTKKITAYSLDTNDFFGGGSPDSPESVFSPLNSEMHDVSASGGILLEHECVLKPGEKKTLQFAFGYGQSKSEIENLITGYRKDPETLFQISCDAWKGDRVQFSTPDEPWVDRELLWHNYYLRGNLTYDTFFKEHIASQGHVYQYCVGFQGASRDPLQHMMPFIYSNPKYAKEILRYTLKTVFSNGEIPYGIVGSGVIMPSPFIPSDLELWLIWATSEYVLANRDFSFLDEIVPIYPVYGKKAKRLAVKDILKLCYNHYVGVSGIGKHGLQRLSNGDWNDTAVHGFVPPKQVNTVKKVGESVLNAAMTIYTLEYYHRVLLLQKDSVFSKKVADYANNQREAVSKQWSGKWFRRAWLTEELGWIGEKDLWLEPQPWAILGGAVSEDRLPILIDSLNKEVRNPSKIGAMVCNVVDPLKTGQPGGCGTNAGIWPSINGTLIMALAKIDGALAWDEWKKNTLAAHAESYPHLWYGIWSGPDTWNSELSKNPGGTAYVEESKESEESESPANIASVGWTDFPVMNMHPHAWPLYNIVSLMGISFDGQGVNYKPTVPKEVYSFTTPLIGYSKNGSKISGWYAPKTAGKLKISIELGEEAISQYSKVIINGASEPITKNSGKIEFWGQSAENVPLKWELTQ